MYTFHYRSVPYPSLSVFDAPDRIVSTTRRLRSNTALQALALLNDEAFAEAAQALGERLFHDEGSDTQKLRRAFREMLSRYPNDEELALLLRLLDEEREYHAAFTALRYWAGTPVSWQRETAPWVTVARVLLNLDEFITRE
jgi:hypothetical protein